MSAITRTKWIMIAERLWLLLLPAVLILVLFVSLSWLGGFRILPDLVRIIIGIGFACGLVTSFYRLKHFEMPTRAQAVARTEAHNKLPHQPVQVQSDTIGSSNDPMTTALWRAHQKKMAAKIGTLRTDIPRTNVPKHDPWALRAAVALLFVTAIGVSSGSGGGSLGDVFHSHNTEPSIPPRIDAWVTPPDYTGRAPIFLTARNTQAVDQYTVPQGSLVRVRILGGSKPTALSYIRENEQVQNLEPAEITPDSHTYELTLKTNGTLRLGADQTPLNQWTFELLEDMAPRITLVGKPKSESDGTLNLTYTIQDDYGAVQAQGLFELQADLPPDAHPLYEAPELPLTLPRFDSKQAQTATNLSEHPWAGTNLKLSLHVTDGAGNTGSSEPVEYVLPRRVFTNKLALAVLELRQFLALNARTKPFVREMLDLITLHPEATYKSPTHHLALRSLYSRLDQAYTDDQLRNVVDYMWELSVAIEDGSLTAAERRLRDARQALSDALENGAGEEEIDRLMAELRRALAEYMRELAQRQKANPEITQEMLENLPTVDLERMMDEIERLMKEGKTEQAEQLLSQLEQMLGNMMVGQHSDQQGDGRGQAQRQMNELGELMREQQRLMDETFRQEQQRGNNNQQSQQGQGDQQGEGGQQFGQNGQPGQGQQPGSPGLGQSPGQSGPNDQFDPNGQAQGGLEGQQRSLQNRLNRFSDSLRGMGIDPGNDFADAGREMGEAGESLGRGDNGQALGNQGEALEAMRRGAQSMMEQLQQQSDGQTGGTRGQANNNRQGEDPLGRPQATTGPDNGQSVKIPEEIDAERARRILDAIRKRLGDAAAPALEKSYLERLLELN